MNFCQVQSVLIYFDYNLKKKKKKKIIKKKKYEKKIVIEKT